VPQLTEQITRRQGSWAFGRRCPARRCASGPRRGTGSAGRDRGRGPWRCQRAWPGRPA